MSDHQLIFCTRKVKRLKLIRIKMFLRSLNPLSAKFIKWSNTLKQIVGKLPTICLSVFDHFSGLALKGLSTAQSMCLLKNYKMSVSQIMNAFLE